MESFDNVNVDIPVEIIKKKRGRKPKSYYIELAKNGIIPEINVVKEKKKRGRKPHPKKEEDINKVPKKRGRKPKKRNFNIVDIEKVKFDEDDEDVILYIPIKINKLETKKNTNIPSPYDQNNEQYESFFVKNNNNLISSNDNNLISSNDNNLISSNENNLLLDNNNLISSNENNLLLSNSNLFSSDNNIFQNNINSLSESSLETNKYNNKVNQILIPFKNSNKMGIWPDRVNIYCWHCCHPFKNKPTSIPMYIKNKTFYVFGAFCSYNCAAAYNLNSNDYNKNIRYELLNYMYKLLYNNNSVDIIPAPQKEILQIFGGNVTIDQFRKNFISNEKEFKILKPPLISIIPQVEETSRKIKKKFK
jgi:hypothetical protein